MVAITHTYLTLLWAIIVHVCYADVVNKIGRFYIKDIGFPGAENIAIDTDNNRIFTADGASLGVNILKYTLSSNISSANISLEKIISFETEFASWMPDRNISILDVTSVKYSPNGYVLAAVVPEDVALDYGWLAFINSTTLNVFHLLEIDLCYLPDQISLTHDGATIIIACEGEPDDNEVEFPAHNPPGSMAIIDVSSVNVHEWTIHNADFEAYDTDEYKSLIGQLYITHQSESFSVNVEPEYSAISDDNKFAYIALQEQNAIGVLDIDERSIMDIYPLGFNDYSVFGLDASDKDDKINIQTYPNLYGMRAPDAIYYMLSDANRHYVFTANEGDSKKFDQVRVSKVTLSNDTFGEYNVTWLQQPENLGRLKVSNLYGKNADGEYEALYTFSSRDFTIWEILFENDKPSSMELVYSSDNMFELITAEVLGTDGFNSDYFNPSFDKRSDDKGPEPESIVVGKCNNGRKYVFIGMERAGGVFVFDITGIDDGQIEFVEYFNAENYTVTWEEDTRPPEHVGDIGPEQMRFVNEDIYGVPLLIVAYPESSSVAMYRIDCGEAVISTMNPVEAMYRITVIIAVIVGICMVFVAFGWFLSCRFRANDEEEKAKKSAKSDMQGMTLVKQVEDQIDLEVQDGVMGVMSNTRDHEDALINDDPSTSSK
eukprot:265006_1